MKNIKNIGIIGKGKMGSDIFNYLYQKDFRIYWICRSQEDCDRLAAQVSKRLVRMHKETTDSIAVSEKMKSLIITAEMKLLADCDLIIETVTEELNIKSCLLTEVSHIVRDDCIITTNTSSISLEKIFCNTKGKERCFGLHFYYPMMLMNIVEINVQDNYSAECFNMLTDFLVKINKKNLKLTKPAHFLLNRIYITLISVAVMIYLGHSKTAKELDDCLRSDFLPLGLLSTLSSAGTFILSRAVRNFTDERNSMLFGHLFAFAKMLESSGYPGGAGLKGIYDYDNDREKPDVINENPLDLEEFKQLILSVLVNEIVIWTTSGYSDMKELSTSMKTVLGMSWDPVAMIQKIGFEKHVNLMEKYYRKYNNEFFKPDGIKQIKLKAI